MKTLYSLLLLSSLFIVLYIPQPCKLGMENGIILCLRTVIPTFFPILLITNIIINKNLVSNITYFFTKTFKKIFGTSNYGTYIVILSWFSGYPVALTVAGNFYKENIISKPEYLHIIKFCNNPSPAFIISYLYHGFIFYYIPLWKVLLCIYGSSILTGIVFNLCNKKSDDKVINHSYTVSNNTNPIHKTINALINICSFVLIFSIIAQYITLIISNELLRNYLLLFTEITTGLQIFTPMINSNKILLLLIASNIGGACVTFQTLSVITNFRYYIHYFKGKFVSSLILCSLYFLIV